MKFGTRWYIACPEAGKTLLATQHAALLTLERRHPCLVIDTEEVGNFASMRHARTAEEAIDAVWRRGETIAYTPSGVDDDAERADMETIARAVKERRRVVLLVDEASVWLSRSTGRGTTLLRVMRTARHKGCDVLLTTQHLTGDVPAEAFACAPIVYVGRTTAWPALERLKLQYRLDPDTVQKLPQFQFLVLNPGFSLDA